MDETDSHNYVSGVFWQAETPDRQAEGRLELENADLPSLLVTTPLFDERTYKVTRSATGMTIATSADPYARVADYEPRTFWGELSNGAAASAIGAQGGRRGLGFDFSQQFRCRRVVVGAHVDGHQEYAGTRFCLAEPHWPLPRGEATTNDGSTLRVLSPDQNDGKQWIEFEPTQPATLNYFDWQVMNPITTLYALVTANSMVHRDVWVRLNKDSPWMPVYEGTRGEVGEDHDMIATKHLTPERLARWIDVRKDSDGLDAAVIDERSGGTTIQTQVLSLSAVAEGLHRKLFANPAQAKRVPAASKKICADARDAARTAAVVVIKGDQFTDGDRTEFAKAVGDALSRFNERTFRSRMQDLVDVAERVVPGITKSFKDWPDAVCEARNTLAHQGNESLDDFEEFFEVLVAVKSSLVWVLRTVLLDRAGIDPETIQFGYSWNTTAYGLHLANVRNHLLANGRHAADGLQRG